MAFDADDLSPTEQFVVDRTREGEVADFTPMAGTDGMKPAIRAGFLRKLLLQLEPGWLVRMPGVRVKGARIEGALDLSDCAGAGGAGLPALSLEGCDIPDAIDLSHSRLARLSLRASRLRRLQANETHIGGECDLAHISPLPDAHGDGSYFTIEARSLSIDGDLMASSAKLVTSRLSGGDMMSAPVGDVATRICLFLQGAEIAGSLLLDEGFDALGAVWLNGARIGGVLQCAGGQFLNRTDDALGEAINAQNIVVGASVNLTDSFQAEGRVDFMGARIGGSFELDHGSLKNDYGVALSLAAARVEGHVRGGVKTAGRITLSSVEIAHNLDLRGAEISNPRPRGAQGHGQNLGEFDTALDAANIRIGGALLMRGAKTKGEIHLADARIDGYAEFGGGRFLNSGGWAIRGPNIRIGGDLTFKTGADEPGPVASKTVIEGSAKFDRARIEGEVCWDGLDLRGKGADGQPAALSFADADIARSVRATLLHAQAGRVDLSGASCAALDDDLDKGWGISAVKVDVEGFSFQRLDGAETGWRRRLKWLKERAGAASPQPYAALARIYARAGKPDDMRRALRAQAIAQNASQPVGVTKTLSGLFDLVAGYGFSTRRIATTLLIYLVVGVAGVLAMDGQRALITADGRACNGAIEPALYAIDVALPVIDLGQENVCAPGRAPGSQLFAGLEVSPDTDWRWFEGVAVFRWLVAVYAVLGALLTALAVITFSGVMKPKAED